VIRFRQADISRPLHEAIEIEVRTRPRAHVWLHRGKVSLRLRYRVTRAVTVIGARGKGYGPFLYGYRVGRDGVIFGREHLIHNTRRMETLGLSPTTGWFPVPEGTVFKDLSGLTDDEVAAHVTLDVRELPAEEFEALKDAVSNLDAINLWLLEVTGELGHMLPGPELTTEEMVRRGLIAHSRKKRPWYRRTSSPEPGEPA
jgi:hypothetical protein